MAERSEVTTPDGRTLEVLTGGDPEGRAWLYHSGSPSAAVPFPWLEGVAADLGLRMITYSRPGYGGSSPRLADADTRMVDDVLDVEAVLAAQEAGEFVTLGWSGGGPRALACAALLPDRCRAAATLAGVGPRGEPGLDWFEGMAAENQAEYAAAVRGREAYGAFLEQELLPVMHASDEEIVAGMGDLLPPVDRDAWTGELGDYITASFRGAVAQGVVGTRDDGLQAVAPWGFDLTDIRVPVAVWQGRLDAMVPFGHGTWLAEHVPTATPHLFDDEGHVSLVTRMPEILADLTDLAGW